MNNYYLNIMDAQDRIEAILLGEDLTPHNRTEYLLAAALKNSPKWVKTTLTFADLTSDSSIANVVLTDLPAGTLIHSAYIKITEAFKIGEDSLGELTALVANDTTNYIQATLNNTVGVTSSADIQTAIATDGILSCEGEVSLTLEFTPASTEVWADVDAGGLEVYLLVTLI